MRFLSPRLVFWSSVLFFAWMPFVKADVQDAVEAYKKGYALFFNNKFSEALPLFLRFQTLLPKEKRYRRAHAEVKYYIGICHYQLKAYPLAKQSLRDYLKDKFRKKDKDTSAKDTLAALKELLKSQAPPERRPPDPREPAVSRDPSPPRDRPSPETPLGRPDPNDRSKPPAQDPPVERRKPDGSRLALARREPPLDPPPIPPPSTQAHPAAWVFLGLGLATLAGGLITGLLAQQKYQETTKLYQERLALGNLSAADISQPYASAQERGLIATILYSAGGGLAATGLIMIFAWRTPTPAPPPPGSLGGSTPTPARGEFAP